MSVIKLLIVVVSGFTVANCAGESRKIDEVQYKNHRTASVGNDTLQNHAMLHKTYPVYPAQVYANLSNVRDFGAVKLNVEQQLPSRSTEMPMDVVRVFFTATTSGKRKPLQDATAGTTPVPDPATPTAGSVYRTVTPSTYIVTARNVAVSADTKDSQHKSPIYSVPRSEVKYATSTVEVDFRGAPTITGDESRTKTKFNGTKIRRVLKKQNQAAQSSLYSAATSGAQVSPQFVSNQRNLTAFAVSAKANATAVASSKPFATVLVPKHVLDGGVMYQQQQQQHQQQQHQQQQQQQQQQHQQQQQQQHQQQQQQQQQHQQLQQKQHQQQQQQQHQQQQQQQQVVRDQAQREDSFRPIVPPIFTPYNSPSAGVDTNSIVDNRRISGKHTGQHLQRATAATVAPKLSKYGFVKPLTYKVEEYVPGDVQPSVSLNRGYGTEQDRSDRISVISQKRDTENLQKRQSLSSFNENSSRHVGPPLRESLQYGIVEPAVGQFDSGSGPQQYREFYQATEWPVAVKHEKSPQNFGSIRGPVPVSAPLAPKEYFNGPPSVSQPQTESSDPEFVMGDLNPKDVLKSLLRDMIKSKQQAEIKPKAPLTMDEIIDSYLNANQQNVDPTLEDTFKIQTDMNCNLRSTKYITDGQCVSTKPVVEAVCADRCLVAANSLSQRHRSSSTDNAQVEALQCSDGDVKMLRVQLKCRDGNMFNNVIKVVTNCRCKLHPTQPQMRKNSQRMQRSTINPDIMAIAAGQF